MGNFNYRDVRLLILSYMDWIPDELLVRIQYFMKLGKWLRLKKPKDFNEKIQLYKLKYRNPLMKRCVDKFEARQYIKEKGLEKILVPIIGIYDKETWKVSPMKFEDLPESFVVKTTDGAGANRTFLCKDKNKIDKTSFLSLISFWLSEHKGKKHYAREWAYENTYPRRLLVEPFMEQKDQDNLIDYKFMCFGGKFKCLWVDSDRFGNHKRGFWDADLNRMKNAWSHYPCLNDNFVLPNNISEMITIAETISRDFPFVRVDLYNVDGQIFFSELTFYPNSGYKTFRPESLNSYLSSFPFPGFSPIN